MMQQKHDNLLPAPMTASELLGNRPLSSFSQCMADIHQSLSNSSASARKHFVQDVLTVLQAPVQDNEKTARGMLAYKKMAPLLEKEDEKAAREQFQSFCQQAVRLDTRDFPHVTAFARAALES